MSTTIMDSKQRFLALLLSTNSRLEHYWIALNIYFSIIIDLRFGTFFVKKNYLEITGTETKPPLRPNSLRELIGINHICTKRFRLTFVVWSILCRIDNVK